MFIFIRLLIQFLNSGSSLQHGSPGSIENLLCPKLRTLEFFYMPIHFNVWRSFFRNHQHLTGLFLREGNKHDYKSMDEAVQLIQLISTLPNLYDFKMHLTNLIHIDAVKQFVETHQNLLIVHFTLSPNKSDVVLVREQLDAEWRIKAYSDHKLVFEGNYSDFQNLLEMSRK